MVLASYYGVKHTDSCFRGPGFRPRVLGKDEWRVSTSGELPQAQDLVTSVIKQLVPWKNSEPSMAADLNLGCVVALMAFCDFLFPNPSINRCGKCVDRKDLLL